MAIEGSVVPVGRTQFFDNAGQPLAGGTVGYYIPATLNFKDTFEDNGLTVLNQNPVPLDASGAALIWGTGLYRMIAKDHLGNQIFDVVTFAETPEAATGGFGAQQALASAATCDLGTIDSHNVLITGTTPINNFGESASLSSPIYLCRTESAITIANGVDGIQVPYGDDYNFQPNDSFLAEFEGGSTWRILAIWAAYPGEQGAYSAGINLVASDDVTQHIVIQPITDAGQNFQFPLKICVMHQAHADGSNWAYGEYMVSCSNSAGALALGVKQLVASAGSDATYTFNPALGAGVDILPAGTQTIAVVITAGANLGAAGANALCFVSASRFGMGLSEYMNTGLPGGYQKPIL